MRRQFTIFATALAVLATGWVAAAQTAGDPSSMSMDELVAGAKKMVDSMENQLTESFKLLEKAIADGDVGATNTRNEAITAMKGLVKLSEENLLTLQQKAAEGDREGVEHEYVKISIAQSKTTELFAQVQTAGGIEVDMEIQDVDRQMSIEATLPLVPESTVTFAEAPVAAAAETPPVFASPFD